MDTKRSLFEPQQSTDRVPKVSSTRYHLRTEGGSRSHQAWNVFDHFGTKKTLRTCETVPPDAHGELAEGASQ